MSTQKGWIGVDLDGTLAHYDKWRGMDHIGEPIAPMVERVKRMLRDGHDVRIFTARVCQGQDPVELDKFLREIAHWTFTHIGRQLPVTCEKDWSMIMLYDDRAVSVEFNRGEIIPLDALQRIAELESQVDDLQGELAQSAAVSRIAELEAERDRLREAMKRIANQPDCYTSIRDLMDKKKPGNADEKRIAQEALKGADHE